MTAGEQGPGSELFEALRPMVEEGNRAFNEGDFETAFAAFPEDVEWHPPESAVSRVLRGKAELIAWFEEMRETIPDWGAELQSVEQVSDRVLIMHYHAGGTGGASGIPTEFNPSQVWEIDDGVVVRVREFESRELALSAAREASSA